MQSNKSFTRQLLKLKKSEFEALAFEVFRYQARNNLTYSNYLNALNVNPDEVNDLIQIPFMPISFFKYHDIKTGSWKEEQTFLSSGTTGMNRSKHHLKSIQHYREASIHGFESTYGPLNQYTILAHLPSYMDQGNSSLIFMVGQFIQFSQDKMSGFYREREELLPVLKECLKKKRKIILIGVTYALLDMAEETPLDLSGVIVMETGGMKGRRKEMVRGELHDILKQRFNLEKIHSEYGMTELLSQAYSQGDGIFECPNWMQIMLRDLNDPFDLKPLRNSGVINVIDLANVDTCSFIETQDMGYKYKNGSFEVIGRMDNTEIRGCNLLMSDI